MKPRYAAILAVLAANVFLFAVLIYVFYVLRPRYYLVIVLPEKTVVQLGPFATQTSCENVRHGMPEMIMGGSLDEKERGRISKFMACVPSR